jgi:hypothetical protein
MFSKSSLLAIAFGATAIASAITPASALSSQVYAGQHVSQPTPPQRQLPTFHREDRTTVGRAEYPMPRRPMRQPFN